MQQLRHAHFVVHGVCVHMHVRWCETSFTPSGVDDREHDLTSVVALAT